MDESSGEELADSDASTPRQRISPWDYFEDLRVRLHTAEFMATLGPNPPWPKIGGFEGRKWLGSGGFGAVVIARDPDLDRLVVLKLCPAVGRRAATMIKREARVLAKFNHANIVTIHGFGRYGRDLFYVMEYFADGDAASMLDEKPTRAKIVETYCLAGEGLAAAHGRGIVHGDFKPSNVLVNIEDQRVCVADFGLARLLDRGSEVAGPGSSESCRGGTYRYMAPELFAGGPMTALTDQWAFCVSVWESLFCRPAFEGHDEESVRAAIERGLEVPKLRDGPTRDVVKALRRGLSIDPRDRYPDMPALILALRSAMAIVPSQSSKVRRLVFPLALALVFAVGLAVLGWTRQARAPAPTREGPRESPAESSEPAAPPSPCAMFDDPGEPEVEIAVDKRVVAACELIRGGFFEDADVLWRNWDSAAVELVRLDGKPNEDAVQDAEEYLIVIRTFVDQAERIAADHPNEAQKAVDYARGKFDIVELVLGPDRVKPVSERLGQFTHDQQLHYP